MAIVNPLFIRNGNIYQATANDAVPLAENANSANNAGGLGPSTKMRALLNSAQAIVANTPTKINLNTIQFDLLGEFNTSLHRFIAKNSGYYFAKGSLVLQYNDMGSLYFYVNGNLICTANEYYNTTLALCDLIHLNANDYLELWCNLVVADTIIASQFNTYLSIFRVN